MRRSKTTVYLCVLAVVTLIGCSRATKRQPAVEKETETTTTKDTTAAVATFAGGCFWCVEADFEKVPGVSKAISGYTGGYTKNPKYEDLMSGKTGHVEAVQVFFDPQQVSYAELVEKFWRMINPTDSGGQFVDRGSQYATAIFYHSENQKQLAEKSKKTLTLSKRFKRAIVTPIIPAAKFYTAEDYHQDFYKKSPVRYKYYRFHSGRDRFIAKHWKKKKKRDKKYMKPSKEEIKDRLTEIQYKVTQKDATEPPFKNEYWDNKKAGIYVDVVSGEPLFSSTDKFDSGTGWPSFTKPLESANITTKTDYKLIYPRTEVRSKHADSHLGHVFKDGPAPTGMRYCINSAALRFVPAEELKKEGYEEFLSLFTDAKPN